MDEQFSKSDLTWILAQSKVPRPLLWDGDSLLILDQKRLPGDIDYIRASSWEACRDAIKNMSVRGAPIIGVCGAFGMALASAKDHENAEKACQEIKSARPTAVDLSKCVDRIYNAGLHDPAMSVLEAVAIEREDHQRCLSLAKNGAELIKHGTKVLTHCNTGSLAAGGFGTALGVVLWAKLIENKDVSVVNTETRPYLQGSRLTSFELGQAGVPSTLIPDSAVSFVMAKGMADLVIVGADRIARNGDTANKIGTLGIAISAKHFGVPFYIAAPKSTFDMSIANGKEIPIEERPKDELIRIAGKLMAPEDVQVYNPAFDITPKSLVTGYITESGIIGAWKIPYLD